MRNLALAVMIVVGLINVDRLYYHGAMLKPVYSLLLRHTQGLV